jgi:hypothetical protein
MVSGQRFAVKLRTGAAGDRPSASTALASLASYNDIMID